MSYCMDTFIQYFEQNILDMLVFIKLLLVNLSPFSVSLFFLIYLLK